MIYMKYIKNGKLILKDKILCGKALAFGDKIVDIIDESQIPADAEVIDAKGGYVAPGLIDIHIHGYVGLDVSDGNPEDLKKISEGIVQNGVTLWQPTTMTVEKSKILKAYDAVRSVIKESKNWNGAAIHGVHSEGPFINPKKKGAQAEESILKPDADMILENADVVTYVTLAPEMDEGFEAIRKIVSNSKVVVSMGHSDASFETALASVDAGVKSTTHLFNAMSALGHRNPGVVGASLKSDVYAELIVDTFHVDKGLYDTVAALKGDKLIFVTDCLPAGGLPVGEYLLGGQKIIASETLCRLEDGTIAGSVLRFNKGVWNVFTNSNLPLWQCVKCATLNPATMLGIADKKGSLDIGKDADIIITDNEFNVNTTIIGGSVRYEA